MCRVDGYYVHTLESDVGVEADGHVSLDVVPREVDLVRLLKHQLVP